MNLSRCLLIFMLFCFVFPPCILYAQPTIVDTKTGSDGGTDVTTATMTGLAVSGTNTCIVVCAYETGTTDISSVVFNGSENLSLVIEKVEDARTLEFWHLSAPTSTTADVVITLTGAGGTTAIMGTAIAMSGCKQALPTLSGDANCTTCSTETVDLTTTVDNTQLLSCIKHNAHTTTFTHGSGQTELSDFAETGGGGERQATSHEVKATAGLETLSSTAGTSGTMSMIAIGVEPVGAGGSGGRRFTPGAFQ